MRLARGEFRLKAIHRRAASWAFAALSLGALVLRGQAGRRVRRRRRLQPAHAPHGHGEVGGRSHDGAGSLVSRLSFITRTSAPARLSPTTVRADDPSLLAGASFAIWGGESDVPPLTDREVSGLKRFIALGGMILVDDFAPETGSFWARREARSSRASSPSARPSPFDRTPITSSARTFSISLLRSIESSAPSAASKGPAELQIVVRGGFTQILYSEHDLLGALAQQARATSIRSTCGRAAKRSAGRPSTSPSTSRCTCSARTTKTTPCTGRS